MKTKIILFLITLCLSAIAVNAQVPAETVKVPAEIKPFIGVKTRPIALETADLNGDNLKDYILVLEREKPETDEDDFPNGQRPLLILLRGKDKKLTEVKRNENIVMCSQCGGVFGDPFNGITVGKNTFTVNHYGGSNWRWTADYKFNYSRIDNTWQLVRIEKTSFHTAAPNKVEKTIMTPPKDFGKVDVADFDPADYEESEEVENSSSNRIKFIRGAYTAQAKEQFSKINEDINFIVKAEKDQRMIVNIIPVADGLATAGTVTAPSGEQDGQPGGAVFNSVLKESGDYNIRISQRPAEHKFPAEFIVEVIILPSFLS